MDRPTVDQYFEDDGFGNLVSYYNSGNRQIVTSDNIGTVDYSTGQICFGPVNIIGSGGNNLPVDSDGNVDDGDQAIIDIGDITIPVTIIPSNNSTIANPSPDTVIEVIIPEISVVPIGTPLPSNIPLNSLTPDIFEVVPTTLDLTDISNPGNLANISCF